MGVFALPLVEFRANRVVSGRLYYIWEVPSVWVAITIALLLAAAGAAFLSAAPRGNTLLAAGAGAFSAWLFTIGGAALRLMPSGDSPVRISVGSGAWLMLVGIVVIWFQGNRAATAPWGRPAAAAAAIAAGVLGWTIGGLPALSLAIEYQAESDTFWRLTYNHVALTLGGTLIAAAIGIPLGIFSARAQLIRSSVIPAAGIIQTVPSLALYGMLIVPLGLLGLPTLGTVPTLVALTLYALLPIVRNTYLGVSGVDPAVIDAGLGMGMRRAELLWRVELPLALPLVLEGLRAALIMTVGIAAVMAIAGAQTLGVLVFSGFGSVAVDEVLLGALPMVVLAIVADQGMRSVERVAVSPGIRTRVGGD